MQFLPGIAEWSSKSSTLADSEDGGRRMRQRLVVVTMMNFTQQLMKRMLKHMVMISTVLLNKQTQNYTDSHILTALFNYF